MIVPVRASLVTNDATAFRQAATSQFSFAKDTKVSPLFPVKSSFAPDDRLSDSMHSSQHLSTSVQPPSSRQDTLPSQIQHSAASFDAIDDHLPDQMHHPSLHRQYARQYDDESALFGERDVSMMTQESQLNTNHAADTFHSASHVPEIAHRYSLPSSYPSSIASSWSRPERSVWFQQKAIIITSIFLAIFIVLFIGAAVFLREKKFDDELAGLDDEEALARIEERMTMGRFSDPVEKDVDSSTGGKLKRHFRRGRKRSEKEASNPDSSQPSSASSSAVKRKRHLVSRWTRGNLRNSDDTMRGGVSDTVSIRSRRSARRVALGDPSENRGSVEIRYDTDPAEPPRRISASGIHDDEANPTVDIRPRSPPPPHPDNAQIQEAASRSEGGSSSNADSHGSNALGADGSLRSPRRVQLDDSDFQAADAAETHHEEMHYMPPAYIPTGSGGVSASTYDGASIAAAIARGDAKHGIPSPAERDPTVSPEVIRAALTRERRASRDENTPSGPVGPVAAHLATDDKAVLGALSAAASMPSAPAVADGDASAPAYGAPQLSAAARSTDAAGPSAPDLQVDDDGFEVAPTDSIAAGSLPRTVLEDEQQPGKGKAKEVHTSSMLPAPPTAIEPAFSPFDEPYRSTGPPGPTSPLSPPGRRSTDTVTEPMSPSPPNRKSEKQKEAEQEQELAQLVASRPNGMDVPTYKVMGAAASAPPLAEAQDDQGTPNVASKARDESSAAIIAEHLPAYERRRESTSAAAENTLAGSAPLVAHVSSSAPSAPPMHDVGEE